MTIIRPRTIFGLLAATLGVVSAGDLRLVQAIENRNSDGVRALLKEHVDVNTPDADGGTPLHWAAHWDDVETADLLIQAGANVNAVNDLGVTPLYLACTQGNSRMVEKLLKAKADPNRALPTGETALMTSARTGSSEVAKLLLAGHADVNAKENGQGQTALMWAVAEKHPEIVQILIENGADVQAHSKGGFTPLLFAARVGDLNSARLLLNAGANVNDTALDGSTPLLIASSSVVAIAASNYHLVSSPSDHEAVAVFLLHKDANPSKADDAGRTPLHAAVETGRPELVKALLEHGANPNARLTKDPPPLRGDFVARTGVIGATPFWLAARAADLDMMRILVAGGADPLMATKDNVTPLMAAVGFGLNESRLPPESQALEAIKLTMKLGANVNAVINRQGQTALHLAVAQGEETIVQFLLENGAKPDIKDRLGHTALNIATDNPSRPRPKIATLLRKYAADTNSVAP